MKRFVLSMMIVLYASVAFAVGTKVSDMPAATSLSGSDTTMVVQGGVNKKATLSLVGPALNATDVLNKVKTVAGAGSGLDADTVDGYHASAFATSAQGAKADAAQPASTAITTTNIGAQSVNYATSAGSATSANNADTVDGYHATAFATASQGVKADNAQPAATAINTGNIASQSVANALYAGSCTNANYATSAGSASTAGSATTAGSAVTAQDSTTLGGKRWVLVVDSSTTVAAGSSWQGGVLKPGGENFYLVSVRPTYGSVKQGYDVSGAYYQVLQSPTGTGDALYIKNGYGNSVTYYYRVYSWE